MVTFPRKSMVKLPENREFLNRIYNVLGQLNVATQVGPGLAQTRKSTARAFHWPSLPVCGRLAIFNCPDTM
jgi:hypothetical protein